MPWGYEDCPSDPQLIKPIASELDLLKQAYEYLNVSSYAEVAKWLTAASGRYISNVGLWKIKKKPFDQQYPSSATQEIPHATGDRGHKKSGRPIGSRNSRKKRAQVRRTKKTESRKKATNNQESEGRTIIHRKRCLKPRTEKRTLRQRRLKPYPNNL